MKAGAGPHDVAGAPPRGAASGYGGRPRDRAMREVPPEPVAPRGRAARGRPGRRPPHPRWTAPSAARDPSRSAGGGRTSVSNAASSRRASHDSHSVCRPCPSPPTCRCLGSHFSRSVGGPCRPPSVPVGGTARPPRAPRSGGDQPHVRGLPQGLVLPAQDTTCEDRPPHLTSAPRATRSWSEDGPVGRETQPRDQDRRGQAPDAARKGRPSEHLHKKRRSNSASITSSTTHVASIQFKRPWGRSSGRPRATMPRAMNRQQDEVEQAPCPNVVPRQRERELQFAQQERDHGQAEKHAHRLEAVGSRLAARGPSGAHAPWILTESSPRPLALLGISRRSRGASSRGSGRRVGTS